jgi:hypothetical protein
MKSDLEAIREEINKEMVMDCGLTLPGWEAGRCHGLRYLLRWIDKREGLVSSRITHVPLYPDAFGFPTRVRDLVLVVNQLVDAVNELKESRA